MANAGSARNGVPFVIRPNPRNKVGGIVFQNVLAANKNGAPIPPSCGWKIFNFSGPEIIFHLTPHHHPAKS
jgi:hypothetical protein